MVYFHPFSQKQRYIIVPLDKILRIFDKIIIARVVEILYLLFT